MFVFVQTIRHRDYFLPVDADGGVAGDPDEHAAPPSSREALWSLAMLVVALVAVVGLAKTASKPSLNLAFGSAMASIGLHLVLFASFVFLALNP